MVELNFNLEIYEKLYDVQLKGKELIRLWKQTKKHIKTWEMFFKILYDNKNTRQNKKVETRLLT